jgi:hypothetical protein
MNKITYFCALICLLFCSLYATAQDQTRLTSSLASGATTANVSSTSSWPSTVNTVQIGNEVMIATTTSSTTLTLIRAQGGTAAAAHPNLTPVKVLWSPGSVFFGSKSGRMGELNSGLYFDNGNLSTTAFPQLKLWNKNGHNFQSNYCSICIADLTPEYNGGTNSSQFHDLGSETWDLNDVNSTPGYPVGRYFHRCRTCRHAQSERRRRKQQAD